MRSEQEIFDELASLCTSPGYLHAIAFFCYRDTVALYEGQMCSEDLQHLFSKDRLIRTEISTLIGMAIKQIIDYEMPTPELLQQYLDRTTSLLEEMHKAIGECAFSSVDPAQSRESDSNPFGSGKLLREPIFYAGEAAYIFQYRDLAPRKYQADEAWLQANKGFTIQTARDVVHALLRFQNQRFTDWVVKIQGIAPDHWTMLPAFSFTYEELSQFAGFDKGIVERVLSAFTVRVAETNSGFRTLHDFNVITATPILRGIGGEFFLLGQYNLAAALYDAPFYWMTSDNEYRGKAMINRGEFTEEFSAERLALVFGKDNVSANVNIYESKAKISGEIDVLVLFGDRAIVLQAKSKRLTMEARRGNDGQIKADFQKSVQDSYDQARRCAELLINRRDRVVFGSREIVVPKALSEIYIFCVVSDCYPALNFHAQQLLKYHTDKTIKTPFVMDVFTLDTMTEMLRSPLRFLSYVNRRTGYHERLLAGDELTILAAHLKTNLWIEDTYDLMVLEDDISADLDVAMSVRRDNVPGKSVPEGILTRIEDTALGRIISQIEAKPDARTIDLGFVLLRLSEEAILTISRGIDTTVARALEDGKRHDFSAPLIEAKTGLTVHCNYDPISLASQRLLCHCEIRKYDQKVNTWFGLCISPRDGSLRFGLNCNEQWRPNGQMDSIVRDFLARKGRDPVPHRRRPGGKIGPNEPCPCASGKKYKKCHGRP